MNELSELLDRNELYDIFKNFAFMTGLGVSLRDLDGKDAMSYYKNGGACICGMLGANQMCVKNIRYSGQKAAELGEPYIYICGCGLVMSASAVMLDAQLIGTVLCGPAMLWDVDEYALNELEEKTAETTALTDEDRRRIAENTPKFSCEEMLSASRILFRLVNYMCRSRNDILTQRQEITQQQATISVLLSENKQKSGKLTDGSSNEYYSPENIKKLLTSVRLGDRAAARKQLNRVLTDIFLYSGGNSVVLKTKIYELTGFLFRAASESKVAGEELLKAARNSQKILEEDISFEELCYCTSMTLENFIDAIYNSRPNIPGVRYLSAAASYIAEHYSENISLQDAADAADISPSYLSHLFRQGLSVTFTDYLSSVRIDAAKELLKSTNLTVTEIAGKVGYEDLNYFIRTFKKTVGMSPGQYRQL